MFDEREWLEADGLGGFASGTVSGVRTRRYHAWLLNATSPPAGRMVLVNGFEGAVITPQGSYPLSTQRYSPDVIHPAGWQNVQDFSINPWPTWNYEFPDGTCITMELFVPHEFAAVVLKWSLTQGTGEPVQLSIRLLFSGRDYHSLHHENRAIGMEPQQTGKQLRWRLYDGVPDVSVFSNGQYQHAPLWYRQFQYSREQERGLDCEEDLASPGAIVFDLLDEPAACILSAAGSFALEPKEKESVLAFSRRLERRERSRRSKFANRLLRSADDYLVQRGTGKTIVAGYPWFTDWGRDTFISLRGLCLATGRLTEAGQILRDWTGAVSQGMLPNRFPDHGIEPEYNSVDASLWFIVAVHDYLHARKVLGKRTSTAQRQTLYRAVDEILSGYSTGTRYHIRVDHDGLLQAGEAGVQLTWMDAKVGDWVVTPRIGKPVEIQALWINALDIGRQISPRWELPCQRARQSFAERFWNRSKSCLYDVVDVNHQSHTSDDAVRPNQILAVGGLPLCLLDPDQAAAVVKKVETELLTPLGLRTLSPQAAEYRPHYRGDVRERDGAYHQGTVWPWLMGSFVEAWLRVNGDTPDHRQLAITRFIQPLLDHLDTYGLGHISEVADGEVSANHSQVCGGCPFQAWSMGELLRVLKLLDQELPTMEISVQSV